MAVLTRVRVLAAKIESSIGTAISLSGTDAALNAYQIVPQYGFDMEDREGQGGFGYLSSVPGGRKGTITFSTDLCYDGSSEPFWATVLLPACGWVGSAGVYKPKSAPPGTAAGVKTLTIAVYENGKVKKLSGAMGDFTIDLPTGKNAKINWTFTGKVEDEADTSILAPTYPSPIACRVAGGYFKHNNVSYCPSTVQVMAGNSVSLLECPTSVTGYSYAYVGNRRPKITCNPIAELVATVDRYDIWKDMTEYAIAIQIPGVTGSIDIAAPKAQILNLQEGDRDGIQSDELEFGCNRNGSTQDEELSITFTAGS